MKITQQIARNIREIHFGGNWSFSCFQEHLKNVGWQQATTQLQSFNTIAALVFHSNYYVNAVLKVIKGGPLVAKDRYSFDHPPINSEKDWQQMLTKTFDEAREFASLVEEMPDNKLSENIAEEKYGNYYRNLHGTIEHCHYHLGQMDPHKTYPSNQSCH